MMMAAALGVLVSCGSVKSGEEVVAASRDSKVVVAYVTSWSEVMPDPQYMTHINYAFGHVNESFNGVKIDNEERLRQIVDLRKQKPELKVLLSIGGWGSGRFSEMAANDEYRRAFAADCDRVVKEFALDGIDIDWEYPTSSMANIYNPQIQISVVSGTKRSIFRQKNKTKRSKKRLHTTLIKPEQKVNEDLCSGFIVS